MLEGGEDPRFIARRMVILASEDVGNADPQALQVAVAAAHAVEHVGMPEAQLALSQAADLPVPGAQVQGRRRGRSARRGRTCASTAPSCRRPTCARAAYPGARPLGRGQGYDCPTTTPSGVSSQELLPDEVVGARFYAPGEGERELAERLAEIRRPARPRAVGR